jgi:hypothetical protein
MRYALSLVALLALAPSAQAGDPDVYPMGYELYIPSKYFRPTAGPNQRLMTVINAQSEWEKLWGSLEPEMARNMAQKDPYPVPEIDFTRYSLLVAALGSGGGESMAIEAVRNIGSDIIVNLVALRPGSGCMVTTEMKYPIALALIPRTDKSVRFGITTATFACGGEAH